MGQSAAERQRKRIEKLRNEGKYQDFREKLTALSSAQSGGKQRGQERVIRKRISKARSGESRNEHTFMKDKPLY